MDNDNYLGRVLPLLLLTWAICIGLYFLPDTLWGYSLKRVDLLSDLREKPATVTLDSLRRQLAENDTLEVDSVALRDSLIRAQGIDSTALALRDSLYRTLYGVKGADSLGRHIEDYSVGHVGLKRFFAALRRCREMGRPARVAFLGDSFIEGDIMVADVRSGLQQRFGGGGVGFVPVEAVAAQYRPTVEAEAEGWRTWSILTDHTHRYTLPGLLFDAMPGAALHIKAKARYPELAAASTLKLLYERSGASRMELCVNGTDTLSVTLPPTEVISQYVYEGKVREASFRFLPDSLRALGVVMEETDGVSVDNFSLRGNSGLNLERLDSARCRELASVRPYDLIVLQYGLNVVSDSVMQYGWYGARMSKVVRHLKRCFPEADLLMLGVSDRGHLVEGQFGTMPAVLALLHAQRKAARQAGIPFWNLFGAMGGEGSMVRYVANNWASKDYTHLSFGGGKQVAEAFLNALLSEKEFYDEAEKVEH